MNPSQFLTKSLSDARVARILAAAIEAADPARLVAEALNPIRLQQYHSVRLLALGKAAPAMTRAAVELIPDFAGALIITKHAAIAPDAVGNGWELGSAPMPEVERIRILEAGHPVPDARSTAAGETALDFASQSGPGDLLICLISGGGSSLATAPVPGTTLEDLQQLTRELLASGATIEELNIVRRRLDRVKGGGLALAARGAVLSLILSDVPGDHLEAIASGPTVIDPTTGLDAIAVLGKYRIRPPAPIARLLEARAAAKPGSIEGRVENMVIGNNQLAVNAAAKRAEAEGFRVEIASGLLGGEARQVGANLAREFASAASLFSPPFCLVAGGETTVTLAGKGMGGRNQELALAAVGTLEGLQNVLLISLATDGEDGPTDAAGAVVSGATQRRAGRLGMRAMDYLERNDSHAFFDALGDLIKTGPTGTNVNDLVLRLCL